MGITSHKCAVVVNEGDGGTITDTQMVVDDNWFAYDFGHGTILLRFISLFSLL